MNADVLAAALGRMANDWRNVVPDADNDLGERLEAWALSVLEAAEELDRGGSPLGHGFGDLGDLELAP